MAAPHVAVAAGSALGDRDRGPGEAGANDDVRTRGAKLSPCRNFLSSDARLGPAFTWRSTTHNREALSPPDGVLASRRSRVRIPSSSGHAVAASSTPHYMLDVRPRPTRPRAACRRGDENGRPRGSRLSPHDGRRMVHGWSTSPRFQQNRAVPASRRFLPDSRRFVALVCARQRALRPLFWIMSPLL
jgi:hypothetical protein